MLKNILKKNKIKLSNELEIEIKPMTLDESVDFVFLFLPFMKFVKNAKEKYESNADPNTYSFVIRTLLEEVDKETLYKAFSLTLHCDVELLKKVEYNKLTKLIPNIVKTNDLFELFFLLKSLGAV